MQLRLLATLSAAVVVFGLAACGSSSSSTTSSSSSKSATSTTAGSDSASAVNAALAKYLAVPTKLVVSTPLKRRPPIETDVYLNNGVGIAQQINVGLQAASAVLGWHYSALSVDSTNPATITSAMLEAINHGANAVFVAATPVAIFKPALATAKQKGVAVIDIASGDPPTPGITALVNDASQNGTQLGSPMALAAIAAAEKAGTDAHIVVVTSPVFQTILGTAVAAAQHTVTQYCPRCSLSVLNIAANDLFGGQTPAQVVSYLQSHPDTNTILEASSLTDPGLTAALKGAGLSNVRVFGEAALQPQVTATQAGANAGWVIVPFQLEGWMAVDAAARAFTGGDPAVYNRVSIPSYMVTHASSSAPTEFPQGYDQEFKRMWHVS